MLTGISWQSAAVNQPKFMLWRVVLSIHGMLDYPVRRLSRGESLMPEQLSCLTWLWLCTAHQSLTHALPTGIILLCFVVQLTLLQVD